LRNPHNPIVDAARVGPPSSPDLEIVGVFNAGVAVVGDEVVLLLRVAEAVKDVPPSEVATPIFDVSSRRIVTKRWPRTQLEDGGADDSRVFRVDGSLYLSSISHLRRARSPSNDGVHFVVDPIPAVTADDALEAFGVEDPRITRLDDTWWVTYTAVSGAGGIATGLLRSTDDHLRTFERLGIIFAPPNRDVAIFPERIRGRAFALHRPMPHGGLGRTSIWLASSPSTDLRDWGQHHLVAGPRAGAWDDEKVGAGAVPFRIVLDDGRPAWLAIYHGVKSAPTTTYALGALLLDYERPHIVLARSAWPFLSPEAPYEREGFFGRVVFTCGAIHRKDDDVVRIYYGAADGVTCVADVPLTTILSGLAFEA
jgi:beta-1,2-mannobiose phosphorylase / 1,2-beta-oligomannan phosphorylase